MSHREDQGRVSVWPAVAGSRGPESFRLGVGLGSRTAGAGIPPPLLTRPVMRPLFSHFRDFVSSWVKWVMVMSTPRAGGNGVLLFDRAVSTGPGHGMQWGDGL